MAQSVLQSLFRESKNRPADRAAFVQAMARLSSLRSSKEEQSNARKAAKDAQKGA